MTTNNKSNRANYHRKLENDKQQIRNPSMIKRIFQFISTPFVWMSTQFSRTSEPQSKDKPKNEPVSTKIHPISIADVDKFNGINSESSGNPKTNSTSIEPAQKYDISQQSTFGLSKQNSPSFVPKCAFLFLGLDGAGTTSTISNLFKVSKTSMVNATSINGPSIREISEQLSVPGTLDKLDLKIIDASGLCKGHYLEQDAEIITALQIHLKQSLPNQIPNVTFLVTRFDDNRFEGEASELTKMFTALSHCREVWTDFALTNIILVLTNCQKVDSNCESIEAKEIRFQKAFHTFFHASNNYKHVVLCVLVDNLEDTLASQQRLLLAILKLAEARKDTVSPTVLNHIRQNSQTIFVNPKDFTTPIQTFLPKSKRKVNQLLDLLLQGQPYKENTGYLEDKDSDEIELRPYKVKYFTPTGKTKASNIVHQAESPFCHESLTVLPFNSKLMLADRSTEVAVQDLNVGDKLLDKNMNYNTIISIEQSTLNSNHFKGKWVGRIFVEVFYHEPYLNDTNSSDMADERIVLQYSEGKLKHEKLNNDFISDSSLDSATSFFILELDKPNSTFISDGYVFIMNMQS